MIIREYIKVLHIIFLGSTIVMAISKNWNGAFWTMFFSYMCLFVLMCFSFACDNGISVIETKGKK